MRIKNSIISRTKKAKRRIVKTLINMRGWRTDRKLVVLESDDWGSIRMPSKEVYEKLLKSGDKVACDPFTKFDSLESESDLSFLFEVLTKYKDYRGNYPVITANCAVANPNFDKIISEGFREFYYEPVTETFQKYPHHTRSFTLWQKGMERKIFFPQLHCREHMNISRWLKHLQNGKSDVITALHNRMISTGDSYSPDNIYGYMDALNYDTEEEMHLQNKILKEGSVLFKQIFGYPAQSFIAPCYIWDSAIEKELANNGVYYIQGRNIQFIPSKAVGTNSLGRKRHFIGQKNEYNQIYLIRNCEFEPSMNINVDWVDICLYEMQMAFNCNKPATICTHRLNYIGSIDLQNRDKNLKYLSLLLSEIIKRWPEVEFVTSVELGEIIRISERMES